MSTEPAPKWAEMPKITPNAAGLDISASEIVACVPSERAAPPIQVFSTYTPDLHRLADWLQACGIETVASTWAPSSKRGSNYWKSEIISPTRIATTSKLESPAIATNPNVESIQRTNSTIAICLRGEGNMPMAHIIAKNTSSVESVTSLPFMEKRSGLGIASPGIWKYPKK